jgi:hypothetical protein
MKRIDPFLRNIILLDAAVFLGTFSFVSALGVQMPTSITFAAIAATAVNVILTVAIMARG